MLCYHCLCCVSLCRVICCALSCSDLCCVVCNDLCCDVARCVAMHFYGGFCYVVVCCYALYRVMLFCCDLLRCCMLHFGWFAFLFIVVLRRVVLFGVT